LRNQLKIKQMENKDIKQGSIIQGLWGYMLVVNKKYNEKSDMVELEGYELHGNKKFIGCARLVCKPESLKLIDGKFEKD